MNRTGGWAGIIGTVGMLVGLMLVSNQTGSEDGTDKTLEFFAKSSNNNRIVIGAAIVCLAAAFLVYFFLALREHLADGTGAAFVGVGGSIFVVLGTVAAIALASVSASSVFGNADADIKSMDVINYAQSLGYGMLLLAGGAFAGLTMVAVGVAGRGGHLPGWLCWVSIIVGVIVAIGSLMFLPLGLFFVWAVIVSIVMLRRADATAVATS